MSNSQTPVVFTGKAGEYFGIWIVNLLLSIITLGIYSAWAKVRRKKYFYNNTLIDDVAFDYHASPIAILKGRIIAVVLFVLYQVLAQFSPVVGGILLILFLAALPWIVVRGMTFNARNSSHRGLRFDFDGTYGQATLTFVIYPILIFITLGLALPFVMQRLNKFAFEHHKFGLSRFQMNALVKDFYMIYLKLFGVLLAIGLIFSFAINNIVASYNPTGVSSNPQSYEQQANTSTSNGGFIKAGYTDDGYSEEDYLKDLSPEERAEFEAQMREFEMQMQQEGVPEDMESNNPMENIFGPYASMMGPMIYLAILAGLLFYAGIIFIITAYVKSRISNLVWNHTNLEHVSFISNQRMRDLTWLYLSNAFLVIFTLGLATPWAQIRMARYRAAHLVLIGENDWDKFVGEKKQSTRAMGEEIAEMFDVDLSFG
jgi:uncharacterized membrane protein YjgN (DUF898 family)